MQNICLKLSMYCGNVAEVSVESGWKTLGIYSIVKIKVVESSQWERRRPRYP